jgi:hypothetical protein
MSLDYEDAYDRPEPSPAKVAEDKAKLAEFQAEADAIRDSTLERRQALGRALREYANSDLHVYCYNYAGIENLVDNIVETANLDAWELSKDGTYSFDLTSFHTSHVDLFFIFLVLYISEDFFEYILHRDDSSRSTVLIEDERDMTTRLLEFLEEIIERLREWYFHDFFQVEGGEFCFPMTFSLELECFTKCEHIVDIIGRFSCYWQARMR